MIFEMNGRKWQIVSRKSDSPDLMRSDGSFALGVTDDSSSTVYICEELSEKMLVKVITHELVHCACFSYGVILDIEVEEIAADFLATYGREVIEIADDVIKRFVKIF